jgi:4-carboxymuconolactone decarboxylase
MANTRKDYERMRLTPLSPDTLDPERRVVHDTIVELMVRGQPQIIAQDETGALIGPFPAMLHFPRFGVPALRFLGAIGTEARLPSPVRETAILTIGAYFYARYEVYAHEMMAKVAGLSDSQIATLAAGERPADLPAAEAIAHDVAKALSQGSILPASTYARAVTLLGEDGVGELVFLIGGYCLIAMALNAFDVPVPEADNGAQSAG